MPSSITLPAMISPKQIARRAAILAAALGIAALASSCGNGSAPLDPPALAARGLKPGEGYIVATFHSEVRPADVPREKIDARSRLDIAGNGQQLSLISAINPAPSRSDRLGEILVIPVTAGNYEITAWFMTGTGRATPITVKSPGPIKVPFQVRPGEATYIGRYDARAMVARDFYNFPVFADGIVRASDHFTEDQARIASRYPSIKPDQIKRSDAPLIYQAEMGRFPEPRGFSGRF